MVIRQLAPQWIDGAVALQSACFPPPFDPGLLWNHAHLDRHIAIFPEGQFVATEDDVVVGSATSLIVSEPTWIKHGDWESTVGGHYLAGHDDRGSTLYGVDVSVHPDHRGKGVGRKLYEARFGLLRARGLARFGTACRIPDWRLWAARSGSADQRVYVDSVLRGDTIDRTLTPLLRYGLRFVELIQDYMEDEESGNAAALLEWTP